MMIPKQRKSSPPKGGNRLLISINVLGSAGPLRFLVNEEELVITVIETALRNYAREGRLPVLGSDLNGFLLYCANAGTDPLSPLETIGSRGGRNFMLCKKPPQVGLTEVSPERKTEKVRGYGAVRITRKSGGVLKSWINKSLSFKISSH